jgi:hypothetical protein
VAKKTYRLLEQAQEVGWEPAEGLEAGAEVDLDLNADQERALVAAGWIEPADAKKETKGGKK